MSTAGMRNVDGELLLAAAIVHECGHARCADIGPIRYLETYRRDLVGARNRANGATDGLRGSRTADPTPTGWLSATRTAR